jgi:pyruvate/2-oxoglutarate dehydrogenase complex dihydrolipoamide acyltransferase (E2) component
VGEVVASPVAKRLLRENNLTLAEVAAFAGGSVRRIGEEEVNRYLAARPASPSPGSNGAAAQEAEAVPYAGLRRTIGDRMSRSLREMAQLTLSSEADVTELVREREARKAQASALSYTALAARAVALSLPRHPYLNASLEGESIRLHSSLNLGIAVNLADGLVVPVIKEAGARSAADLTAEINRLGELARAKGLTVEDNSGGTFTITNLGAFEVDVFTPIINPPQVAILGIGRIRNQAGVKDGQFSPRKMLWLSLTFDHRLVDGAPAAAFLKEVRERLENPAGLFD